MRIVHVITRLIIGGAQENTLLTCEGLAERGHDVYLLSGPTTGPEGSLAERARAGRYVFEEVPDLLRRVSPTHDRAALSELTGRFRALRPDVVHTHSSKAGILGRWAAHRASVPAIVHTIHGMSFNRTQPWVVRAAYAAAERFCAKRCHAIVSVADAMTRQALAAGVGRAGQFETIRSGMEVEKYIPQMDADKRRWGFEADDIVVGTVARLFANKGYEQLLEIMSLAARSEPRLRFLWVGDGAHRAAYERELARRGLAGLTRLAGLLPPEEMPGVLASIDILAHTSQWEGLPRAAVQALLMTKPVVSFDIDGAPEVVIPGQTGELAALGDIGGFAEKLVALARDADKKRRYGAAGRELCLREFDWRLMVDRLEVLYRRIVARG